MKRAPYFICVAILAWSGHALAGDPRFEPNFHVAAGAGHAVGGAQSSEFGSGAVGSAAVELPITSRTSAQASAGALVLSKGESTTAPGVAETSTGAAFLGTLGVRLRAFGPTRVAGPWMDSNVGVAGTGGLARPAFDAHLGWDFRVSRASRIDVGPFLGYTQIFQPNSALREDDARVLSVGIALSLGTRERARPAEPVGPEAPPPPPPTPDREGIVEAEDVCPDGEPPSDDGCNVGEIRIVENRLQLDDIVHFEFDSAKIREKSHRLVRKVADFLNAHEDIIDVSIEGHADLVGTEDYNQKLSAERALSMREMLARFGVARARLHVVAHGKSQPKVATSKPEEENRRVELIVTRRTEEKVPKGAPANVSAYGRNSQ